MPSMNPSNSRADASPTSGSRRRAADATTRFEQVRTTHLRLVGTVFLRVRPLVVAPVAVVNSLLLATSRAPIDQRIALGVAFGSAIALFVVERWLLGRRTVSAQWLAGSLALTTALLGIGCACSGGIASPLLPLLAAPPVVAASAFGRTRVTLASGTWSFAVIAALALAPPLWPALAAPYSRAMTVAAFGGLLGLAYAGVAGLVDAHARTGEILDRMRLATIDEAASRMRAIEQVGAKVAHELKNPLAGMKALLQLVRGGELTPKAAERLDIALGEVDRMDGIVRDYLSFARPLADLELGEVEVGALAADVVSVLGARAQLAGITLATNGGAFTAYADARRLREAIYNLVDNAIAATPRGGHVSIAVRAEHEVIAVTIDDTGAGIDPGIASAGAFVTTKPDGHGLGLTIARAAVAQHGGTLSIARRTEGGTRAQLRIPARGGAT
jgi:signal transduction histidine kinase